MLHDNLKATEPQAPTDPGMLVAALLAKRSSGGRQRAGWLGDAIYAANDGLGGIFGIVSGVAGATFGNQKVVLLAGLSGVIARAISAGTSAYLAAKGDREIYESGVSQERDAIASNRPQAQELLSMYLQVRGLPVEDADSIVRNLEKRPHQLLTALAMMRLHSTEEALSNPLRQVYPVRSPRQSAHSLRSFPFSFSVVFEPWCGPPSSLWPLILRWERRNH
jgi:hypothetical protein